MKNLTDALIFSITKALILGFYLKAEKNIRLEIPSYCYFQLGATNVNYKTR